MGTKQSTIMSIQQYFAVKQNWVMYCCNIITLPCNEKLKELQFNKKVIILPLIISWALEQKKAADKYGICLFREVLVCPSLFLISD